MLKDADFSTMLYAWFHCTLGMSCFPKSTRIPEYYKLTDPLGNVLLWPIKSMGTILVICILNIVKRDWANLRIHLENSFTS